MNQMTTVQLIMLLHLQMTIAQRPYVTTTKCESQTSLLGYPHLE